MEDPDELVEIPAFPTPPQSPVAAEGEAVAAAAADQTPPASIDPVVEKALADVLDPGDRWVLSSDAMVRESLHLFEKCKVALSEQRLFVLRLGRGEDRWHLSYPRSRCTILKLKKRFDGSQLVIVGHGKGVTGLYFSRGHAANANAIFAGMPTAGADAVVDEDDSP
jgi:hypothetical protein